MDGRCTGLDDEGYFMGKTDDINAGFDAIRKTYTAQIERLKAGGTYSPSDEVRKQSDRRELERAEYTALAAYVSQIHASNYTTADKTQLFQWLVEKMDRNRLLQWKNNVCNALFTGACRSCIDDIENEAVLNQAFYQKLGRIPADDGTPMAACYIPERTPEGDEAWQASYTLYGTGRELVHAECVNMVEQPYEHYVPGKSSDVILRKGYEIWLYRWGGEGLQLR